MSINNQIGGIYLYKNDPKEVHKGVHITNVRQAQGGFAPLLAADDYKERKFDNTKYAYDSKAHHGTRPMHKSTLSLTHVRPEYNNYQTHNNFNYRGYQLRPEYLQHQGEDQFRHHFDLAFDNNRAFRTSYGSEFYRKNEQNEYVNNFDLMPKYSVGKQIRQLEKDGKPKTYPNRESKIRDALVMNEQEPNYWTQYNRTHGYLGRIRGNGVSKDYPDRPAYNIFTGELLDKPSWSMKENYKLVSGNIRKTNSNM